MCAQRRIDYQAMAAELTDKGWPAVPWNFRSKKPANTGWSVGPVGDINAFKPGEPPGLLPGRQVADRDRVIVTDVDLVKDNPIRSAQIMEVCDGLLPHTPVQDGRLSAPRTHRYYRLLDAEFPESTWPRGGAIRRAIQEKRVLPFPRAHRIKLVKGGGLDLLGLGACCACPPCPHPSGELRRWNVDGVDTDDVPSVELCGAVEFRALLEALGAIVMELDR